MFCDLVGSTALSARLDPEDMRELIGGYQHRCTEVIIKAGGFVAKYMGDGVLAYFGYPHAHEDDAERAIRAGLELVGAVNSLASRCRIGIATGLVVVGDLIGAGEARERGIVGETPNLAARLQAVAESDQVVIADSTRRLIGDLFDLEGLEPRDRHRSVVDLTADRPLNNGRGHSSIQSACLKRANNGSRAYSTTSSPRASTWLRWSFGQPGRRNPSSYRGRSARR
jgi:class 3 adenylate cyclase